MLGRALLLLLLSCTSASRASPPPPKGHSSQPGRVGHAAAPTTHAVHSHTESKAGSLFDSDSLSSLFSTLFTTFGVIALGYISKRTGFFSREAKAGLGELVGKVALPALLFQAIATLRLSDLKAEFIVGVLVAKALLFLITIGSAKLAGRGLADAAMWGIFVSNSNDLAQGYPLFLTLHSAYSYQLFLTAALQVALPVE